MAQVRRTGEGRTLITDRIFAALRLMADYDRRLPSDRRIRVAAQ
jgi:hypothetical protein